MTISGENGRAGCSTDSQLPLKRLHAFLPPPPAGLLWSSWSSSSSLRSSWSSSALLLSMIGFGWYPRCYPLGSLPRSTFTAPNSRHRRFTTFSTIHNILNNSTYNLQALNTEDSHEFSGSFPVALLLTTLTTLLLSFLVIQVCNHHDDHDDDHRGDDHDHCYWRCWPPPALNLRYPASRCCLLLWTSTLQRLFNIAWTSVERNGNRVA